MKRLLFGGTSEGRKMCEAYLAAGDQVTVCVTSAYARALLPEGATVYAQPLDLAQMIAVVKECAPDELTDATHPYATQARGNIRACAEKLGLPLTRIERPGTEAPEGLVWAKDAREAAQLLKGTTGNILLTTGSNTAGEYLAELPPERVYARVLPTAKVIARMEALGVLPGHLIGMQGPFSEALNGALYDQLAIRYVVSKDSGETGGVPQKLAAARARNIQCIMIARPEDDASR